jgi:hypothetical protein
MNELAVIPPAPIEDMFERAATAYLDAWDELGVPPQLEDIEAVLVEKGYSREHATKLRGAQFEEYLTGRRKEHLIRTMAPRLMAAQMGANLGRMAGEEIAHRLKQNPQAITEKDLVAIMKQGYEFAAKIDKDMDEIKGDKPQVYIDMRSISTGLPDDRAFDVLQEVARRFREEQERKLASGV